MLWQFVMMMSLAGMYEFHVFLKVDRQAVLAGFFLVMLAICMEFFNQWLGPFWIAQESIYQISAGLPVERLLLYFVGGTFVCANLTHLSDKHLAGWVSVRWMVIFAIGIVMTLIEFFLNASQVFRWIRPWTMGGAFVYYLIGGYLLFRFYDASPRGKVMVYGVVAAMLLALGTLHFSIDWVFPVVQTASFH